MAKTKRFMDGGFVPPNTYPFANQNMTVPDTSVKTGGRQEPLGDVMGTQEPVTMYKRGGKVKKYADGGIYTEGMPGMKGKAPQEPEVAKSKAKPKPDPDAGIFTAKKLKDMKSKAPQEPEGVPSKASGYKKGGRIKRYEDGGVTEGENTNIDEDTRARAMAAIRRRMTGEDTEKPVVAIKPRSEAKMLPIASERAREVASASGRARENVAPSGRGAATGSFRSEAPAKAKPEMASKYPTAKERGAQMRQSLEDVEAENVRKRNERAESGKSSLSDVMSGFKRRFGTKAMREEEGMKKGGKVNCYAGGGTVRGGGCEVKGKTKGRMV